MTEEKSLSRTTDDARREAAAHLASAEYKMVTAMILPSSGTASTSAATRGWTSSSRPSPRR